MTSWDVLLNAIEMQGEGIEIGCEYVSSWIPRELSLMAIQNMQDQLKSSERESFLGEL